jgi:MHS family proline/betaine transporter-like MFS transporter
LPANDAPPDTARDDKETPVSAPSTSPSDIESPTPDGIDVKQMPPEDRRTLRRSIAGSALGNAVEWFDYGVYSYVAGYIASAFFPGDFGLVATFGVLALSFIFRPLGGFILGPLGDKVGRQKVMIITIIMMTIPTTLIGVLPTFGAVGMLAPILLLACRIVQGFSTGGEYGGAAVFMAEQSPDKRRGFFGSFLEFGTLAGTGSAALVCTVLTLIVGTDGMADGWWRLPFLLTLPLGAVALWIRVSLSEPAVFAEAASEHVTTKRPFRDLITTHWPQILMLVAFVVLLNVSDYMVLTYMPSYLSSVLGHSAIQSNFTLIVIIAIMMVIINPLGRLSDTIGRKPLLYIAGIGTFVLAWPAFLLMGIKNVFAQFAGIGILGLLLVIMLSSISATLPAMFPTPVRYSGFAIGYNVSTAIFGGTTAAVNEYMIKVTGSDYFPAWYLMGAAVIGLAGIVFMRETAGRSLRGTQLPGENDVEVVEQGYDLIPPITGAIKLPEQSK